MKNSRLFLLSALLTAANILMAQPGSPDPAFGRGGMATTNILSSVDQAFGAALRPDGRLLVVGSATYDSTMVFAAAQFLSDGALDKSFEYDGKFVFVRSFGRSVARAVALYPDGHAILAGTAAGSSGLDEFGLVRLQPNGLPDLSFGTNGRVRTAFNTGECSAEAVAVQPDGKIVAAGFTSPDGIQSDIALARYLPNGLPDSTFGTNGKVEQGFDVFESEVATGIVLQPDGKILLGGHFLPTPLESDYLILRYLPKGTPDSTFGNNGAVILDFDAPFDGCQAIALQPDGKIVAIGYTSKGLTNYISAARLLPDGTPDPSFGNQGKTMNLVGEHGGFGTALRLLPDGKILISGMTDDMDARDFFVMRLLDNGALDWSFGDLLGTTITSVSTGDDNGYALLTKPDGGMLLVGKSGKPKLTDIAVLQFTADGLLDTSFGDQGVVLTDNGASRDFATAMLRLNDGSIVVGGSLLPGDGSPTAEQDPVLLRYTPAGALDHTFQQTGFVVHPVTNGFDRPEALAATPDGGYLSAGQLNLRAGIWKYKSNGYLDNSFGTGGRVISGFPSGSAFNDLSVLPDGRFVAVGRNAFAGTSACDLLQRFMPNGALDQTLNLSALINDRYGSGYTQWDQIHRYPDNKMLLLGLFDNGSPLHKVLVRLHADGSLDASFGDNGFFTSTLAQPMQMLCFTALPDGNILVGGHRGNDFAVGKLHADGTWDTSFGDDGWVAFHFAGTQNRVFKMAVQSDGKIVVTGQYHQSGFFRLAVMRLHPDGKEDMSFLPNGGLTDLLAGPCADVLIEPSGNILVLAGGKTQGIHSDIFLMRLLAQPSVGTADLPVGNTGIVLAYPNPVSESLRLEYELLAEQRVHIRLYDTAGRLQGVLLHEQQRPAGMHQEHLHLPANLPPGMYIIELATPVRSTVLRVYKQ